MSSFRALNDRFMKELAQMENSGSARTAAQRTYEEMVAMLNSSGMQALAEGLHDEALKFLMIAKDVVTADARSGYDTTAKLIEPDLQGQLKAVTLNNIGCFYKNTGRPHLALQYCYSALDIEREMGDGLSMSSTHLNLCSILSAMKRHSDAYDHAQSALQLVEACNPTADGTPGQPAGISLRAVAYHNMAVQLEAMNMLHKAVHMLAMGSEAARSELGPDNTITVSLEKQLARKERVLQNLNARSKRRESARNARGDWTGRKSTNRATGPDAAGAPAAAASAPKASGATRAGSAPRYRSPRTAGNGGRSPIRRPASARAAASHRAATATPGLRSITPRVVTARARPQSAHPVPRVGAHGVTQPTPPPASRARPASAGVVSVGYGGSRRTGTTGVHGRPASAHQPGQRGQGRSGGESAGGSAADSVMDAQFHMELQKIRGKIENEKLVTPEFLQTINDCAQHYYFTNSNAQYRATAPPADT
jgi:tetratricopeptide (TPR) repeat protein